VTIRATSLAHTPTPAAVCARCGLPTRRGVLCPSCLATAKELCELETWTGQPDLCANGHRYTPATTVMDAKGRQCRICVRANNAAAKRRAKQRRREAA
jgi:hypothetical protein